MRGKILPTDIVEGLDHAYPAVRDLSGNTYDVRRNPAGWFYAIDREGHCTARAFHSHRAVAKALIDDDIARRHGHTVGKLRWV